MNTEKLEKLKKSLDNKFIPDNMKEKIRAEIQKLETDIKKDESITATEVKEEVKEIEQKVEQALEVAEKKEEKLEAKKPARVKRTTAPKSKVKTVRKTTTAKKTTSTSSTSKKSIYTIAKEIRKPNEAWKDAVKRAGANMRGESKEVSKKVSSELEKLKAFVKRRKELKGISETNLVSDSKRKGLPPGKRVSPDGNVYYEYRDSMSDRLAPNYPKNAPLLAGGGQIEAKQLDLGYKYSFEKDEDNVGTLYKEGGVYSVIGFENGKHFSESFEKFSDAKKFYLAKKNKVKFANGGSVDLDDVKVKAYKGFHGLQAENYFENVNGYDWNVVTMKRYGGDLVSSARGGKSNKSDGYEMFTFDWDSPSIKLASSRPSRVTEKVIEEQHKLALQTFKDKMETRNFAGGGYTEGIEEDIDLTDNNELRLRKPMMPDSDLSEAEWMAKHNDSMEARDYTNNPRRSFELGGNLAGQLGGGVHTTPTMLDGTTGTHYTGLVGETGALSSGEMFAHGGGVYGYVIVEGFDSYKNIPLYQVIDKSDDTDYVGEWHTSRKEAEEELKDLVQGYARGGSTDRKYLNHSEDYEVRYAKGKNRHGYGNLKFAGGGKVGEGFTIKQMKDKLDEMFPDSFGFEVNKIDEDGNKTVKTAALIKNFDKYGGLTDQDLNSLLFFPQYKTNHDIRFRIYQGGENTYFNFILYTEEAQELIGSFGFKDRGYVSSDYITRFLAFLMEQYGLPFQVNHSVMARGGSTDRKYLNHSEDYEVRYAKGKNRHGYGNLKFADGGAVMANQQIIADASQQYVNYYLGEGASAGMYKKGGSIPNNYAGRTPRDIWNSLTKTQRNHFLHDHKDEILEEKKFSGFSESDLIKAFSSDWFELDDVAKNVFAEHTSRGQYAIGGMMPKVSKRKHRNE